MGLAFGIDLGGTKAEIIALDESGQEQYRHRVPHPRGNYETSLTTLVELVNHAQCALGSTGTLGICHPGAISPETGLLDGCNATWLNDRPFGQDLIEKLGRPVAFGNDANCLALSEASDGAGEGAHCVFAVIIGTGCGGGLSVGRQIAQGAHGMGGEICHLPLPWASSDELPGPPCYCGKSGCLDAWLSGPALVADHKNNGGSDLSSFEIVAGAEAGDAACEATLNRFENRLARSLALLIQTLDPDVIVLGGGLSNIERLYQNVPKLWRPFVAFNNTSTRLLATIHGDSSGVRGAAWLGRDLNA